MADFVFNIAKGRVVEYYNRVKGNDPANSALVAIGEVRFPLGALQKMDAVADPYRIYIV